MKFSHAWISVECLFSLTLVAGVGVQRVEGLHGAAVGPGPRPVHQVQQGVAQRGHLRAAGKVRLLAHSVPVCPSQLRHQVKQGVARRGDIGALGRSRVVVHGRLFAHCVPAYDCTPSSGE